MKHKERRKEIGKMFIDVAKYVLTVAFIGRLFTEQLSLKLTIATTIVVIVSLIIGFFTIPHRHRRRTKIWTPFIYRLLHL